MKYEVCYIDKDRNVDNYVLGNDTILYKKLHENGFVQDSNESDFVIFLANHPRFHKTEFLYQLINMFRPTSVMNNEGGLEAKSNDFKPILTIYDNAEVFGKRDKQHRRRFGLLYWDSSIWQRWVSLHENYEENLDKTIKEIAFNINKKRYKDTAAIEFCEFATRLYRNSYLIDVGANGHSSHVVPFPFFEESIFLKKIEEYGFKENNKKTDFDGFQWRILLVDDKPERDLLIQELLQEHNLDVFVSLEFANDIATAEEKLKAQSYDIILLDYLLGEANGRRDFGFDLLGNVKDFKKGPDNRLWIMTTTSYSSAFIEHLRELDKSLIEKDKWHIKRGASPLNTPNAFVLSLINFFKQQLNEFQIEGQNSFSAILKSELANITSESKIRNWASNTLLKVLNFEKRIEPFKKLQDEGSLFAQTFLKKSNFKTDISNGLFSYLTHLLFMLSSSDGYEWEEMKICLDRVKQLAGVDKEAYKLIYKYISDLKQKYDQ